jgi:hypothetical protein
MGLQIHNTTCNIERHEHAHRRDCSKQCTGYVRASYSRQYCEVSYSRLAIDLVVSCLSIQVQRDLVHLVLGTLIRMSRLHQLPVFGIVELGAGFVGRNPHYSRARGSCVLG